MFLIDALTSAQDLTVTVAQLAPAVENPIDNITPDFNAFGAEFDSLWEKLFAAAWALALIISLFILLFAVLSMASAKKHQRASELAESREKAMWAGGTFAALAAFPVIVGAILAVMG